MVTYPLSDVIQNCPVCDKPVIQHVEYHRLVCVPKIAARIITELDQMRSEDDASGLTEEYRPYSSM